MHNFLQLSRQHTLILLFQECSCTDTRNQRNIDWQDLVRAGPDPKQCRTLTHTYGIWQTLASHVGDGEGWGENLLGPGRGGRTGWIVCLRIENHSMFLTKLTSTYLFRFRLHTLPVGIKNCWHNQGMKRYEDRKRKKHNSLPQLSAQYEIIIMLCYFF